MTSSNMNITLTKLEMRSVEHGICPMHELILYLWPDAWRMHEMTVFPLPVCNLLNPDFL